MLGSGSLSSSVQSAGVAETAAVSTVGFATLGALIGLIAEDSASGTGKGALWGGILGLVVGIGAGVYVNNQAGNALASGGI